MSFGLGNLGARGVGGALPVPTLPIFKAAVAQTKAAAADTLVAMCGDSTTKGVDAASWATAYPGALAADFNVSADSQAQFGGIIGGGDNRISAGSWFNGGGVSIGGSMWEANAAATMTFTPTIAFDSFDLWYFNGNSASCIVKVDGATIDTINTGAGVSIAKNTYSVSNTTHTISMVWVSGNFFFLGWILHNSTARAVKFMNFGSTGSTTSDWATTTPSYSPLEATIAISPSLAIVNLGINDYLDSIAPSTTLSNLQTIVSTLKSHNIDVAMIVPVPSSTSVATLAAQQAVATQIYTVAAQYNLPLYDMVKRWVSWAAVQATFYGGNTIHPTDTGYADEATAINTFLQGYY